MRALYATGRQADALAAYRRARVDPGCLPGRAHPDHQPRGASDTGRDAPVGARPAGPTRGPPRPAELLGYGAVQLFVERARAAAPSFAVDAAKLQTVVREVAEVCRRLDGLPLAIELAAARANALPVAELSARLGDRFRLLTTGARMALPRHQTLRAVSTGAGSCWRRPSRRRCGACRCSPAAAP
jgi:predicted ATPase